MKPHARFLTMIIEPFSRFHRNFTNYAGICQPLPRQKLANYRSAVGGSAPSYRTSFKSGGRDPHTSISTYGTPAENARPWSAYGQLTNHAFSCPSAMHEAISSRFSSLRHFHSHGSCPQMDTMGAMSLEHQCSGASSSILGRNCGSLSPANLRTLKCFVA